MVGRLIEQQDIGAGAKTRASAARRCLRRSSLSAHQTSLDYVRAGLGPADDRISPIYLEQLGLRGRGARAPVLRRGTARRTGARFGAGARYPAAR